MPTEFTAEWYDRYYADNPQNFSPWYASVMEWLLAQQKLDGKFLELGCGNGKLLVQLLQRKLYAPENIYGIEQSHVAIEPLQAVLPNVQTGNIQERLPYGDATFNVVVMTEVIEHLLYPWNVVREIRRVLRPNGTLLLSFPNFLNLPWLLIRVLGELLEKTSWTVLQPVDRLYTFPVMARHLREEGFTIERVQGRVFLPPLIHRIEPEAFDKLLNRFGLGCLALHPLLICRNG
jgi:SAM-dependent methyltransferase